MTEANPEYAVREIEVEAEGAQDALKCVSYAVFESNGGVTFHAQLITRRGQLLGHFAPHATRAEAKQAAAARIEALRVALGKLLTELERS